mmetsp:Transcript_64080/g.134724  ORF Transcript_64080/g.134724 Transcript_64080/m.134724 type:complete len:81 (+) Transcript_64080:196-438(+)
MGPCQRNPYGRGALLVGILWALCFCFGASGQTYTFEEELPSSKTIRTLAAFYVWGYDEAPDRLLGEPVVEFRDLKVHRKG